MSPNEIICQVARETSVTVQQMRSQRMVKGFVNARKIAAQRIHAAWPALSYEDIGRLLGGKHHTTAMNWLGRGKRRSPDVVVVELRQVITPRQDGVERVVDGVEPSTTAADAFSGLR